MKRLMTALAALTLVTAACGSGDDPSSDAPADATTDQTAERGDDGSTTDEATADESMTDEATTETDEATTDGSTTDEPSAGPGDDTDTSGRDDEDSAVAETDDDTDTPDDSVSGIEIRSISDVPEVCRDAMGRFLRAVEPIVSPTDWETATIADFEQIATEFEAQSEVFAEAIGDAGCDDMNFVEDTEGEILIEFAQSEAPGAVGFLEFLNQMRTGSPSDGEGTSATPGVETCQDAIDFLQGLMDEYGSIAMVPASDLMKIPGIAALYADCTVEQLEFFDTPELEEFMGG